MKVFNNIFFKILIIIGLVFLVSCPHKNPQEIVEWEEVPIPKFKFKAIQIPQTLVQSSDTMAQKIVEYINSANDFKRYLYYLNPPDTVAPESYYPPWNYSWYAREGYRILLKVEIFFETNVWMVRFWGTDSITGKYYHNWHYLGADQYAGNDYGSMGVSPNDELNTSTSFQWTTENEVVKYIFLKTSDDGQVFFDFEIHCFADFSGQLIKRIKISDRKFYWREIDGIIEYKFSWNAVGSGQWWKYDVEGNVIDTGSWN